jgi:hypothetical protein
MQALTPAAHQLAVVVKLQMSNDAVPTYTDISGETVTISAAGSTLWDLGQVTYRVSESSKRLQVLVRLT